MTSFLHAPLKSVLFNSSHFQHRFLHLTTLKICLQVDAAKVVKEIARDEINNQKQWNLVEKNQLFFEAN